VIVIDGRDCWSLVSIGLDRSMESHLAVTGGTVPAATDDGPDRWEFVPVIDDADYWRTADDDPRSQYQKTVVDWTTGLGPTGRTDDGDRCQVVRVTGDLVSAGPRFLA
jgi:hypothetical protein